MTAIFIKDIDTVELLRRILTLFRKHGVQDYARSLMFSEGLGAYPNALASVKTPLDFGSMSYMSAYVSALSLLRWVDRPARLDAEEQEELQRVLEDAELRLRLQQFPAEAAELTDAAAIVRCAERHEDACLLLANSVNRIRPLPAGKGET